MLSGNSLPVPLLHKCVEEGEIAGKVSLHEPAVRMNSGASKVVSKVVDLGCNLGKCQGNPDCWNDLDSVNGIFR
jgi:hypothetical protein